MADAAHHPPPASPPSLPDYTHYCDPTNDGIRGETLAGPCLHGLTWWVWLLIILGCTVCVCCIVVTCVVQARRGNSPQAMLRFWEAVLLANHANPSQSRLKGRPLRSRHHAARELVEAQNCCCCLPSRLGVVLIGAVYLMRLAVHVVFAIDAVVVYEQTDAAAYPDSELAVAGVGMDPELRRFYLELMIASLAVYGAEAVMWMLTACCLAVQRIEALRLLFFLLPVDLIHSTCFAVLHSGRAIELCHVDLRIYAATGHVGFRRNYLQLLPPPAADAAGGSWAATLPKAHDGEPAACVEFWHAELAYAIVDCVLCALLLVYVTYIGCSYLRSSARGDGPEGPKKLKGAVRV